MRYAENLERLQNDATRRDAGETVLRELMTLFELPDAMFLLRLVTEARVICAKCNAGRSITRTSGPYCLGCARKVRLEAKSA